MTQVYKCPSDMFAFKSNYRYVVVTPIVVDPDDNSELFYSKRYFNKLSSAKQYQFVQKLTYKWSHIYDFADPNLTLDDWLCIKLETTLA